MRLRTIFIILTVFSVLPLLKVPVLATSATQTSSTGCHTFFGLDTNGTAVQLFAVNFNTPNQSQLYQSKKLNEKPRQKQLIQLRSGEFGGIYHNQTAVKYTTFDPNTPISTVWTPQNDHTAFNYPSIIELSDGTLIASIEYTPDTRAERLTGKSKCFDGLSGMAHCTQDVRTAILKSTDQGISWRPITTIDNDDIDVDRRGSLWQPRLAVDHRDYLYLLVAEQYFDPNPENQKRDTETLWKSTDRGVNWTRIGNVFTAPIPHYQANEGDLVIAPDGRITVVFSSNYHPGLSPNEKGDYLLLTTSTDDGHTWSPVKIVGKFGPEKGVSRVPNIQIVNGSRYGVSFHKFVDPNYVLSYLFSQPNSLTNWGSDYAVEPFDPGNPTINPVCIKDLGNNVPSPTPPSGNPADLTDEGDTPGNQVNEFDYNVLVEHFGKTGTPGWIKADIVKNGKVDEFDYNALVSRFTI